MFAIKKVIAKRGDMNYKLEDNIIKVTLTIFHYMTLIKMKIKFLEQLENSHSIVFFRNYIIYLGPSSC